MSFSFCMTEQQQLKKEHERNSKTFQWMLDTDTRIQPNCYVHLGLFQTLNVYYKCFFLWVIGNVILTLPTMHYWGLQCLNILQSICRRVWKIDHHLVVAKCCCMPVIVLQTERSVCVLSGNWLSEDFGVCLSALYVVTKITVAYSLLATKST